MELAFERNERAGRLERVIRIGSAHSRDVGDSAAVDGRDLALSVTARSSYSYKLRDAVLKKQSGSVVVLDVATAKAALAN